MIWGCKVSEIKEDLAYRGELNQRLKSAKMPFEYGLLWALREGKDREVADRIRMMADYDKFPNFFRLDLKDSDIEALYAIDTYSIQRHRLLLGITRFLEQEDVTTEQGYKVVPLLDLLSQKKFMIDDRTALLKGRLYFALKKVMPANDALRSYEHFVSYDEKRFHGASFNSFFERVVSLAFRGSNPKLDDDDLRAIASCRHLTFIDEEAEVKRWVIQLNSIGNAIESRKGESNDALIHLGHIRSKHLMQWLQRSSSVEAMQPFMSTKAIASPKNAGDAFNKYTMTMKALSRINRAQPMSFDAQTPLTRHAFKLLSRFLDKLPAQDWQELTEASDLPVDWTSVLKRIGVVQQEAILLRLPHLLPNVTNSAREHHFMGDLGL